MNITKSIILALFLTLIGNSCFAEEASHERLLELAKVTGIYEQIAEQKKALSNQARQLGAQIAQQTIAKNPNMPPEVQDIIQQEFEKYMQSASNLIDTESTVNSYVKLISKKLNFNDVETIITFYKSEVGKKYTQSNIAISADWAMAMFEGLDKKLSAKMKEFYDNVNSAILKYKETEETKESK